MKNIHISQGLRQILVLWVIISGLSGLAFLLVQQSARLTAYEIPLQLAEDGATTIQNGAYFGTIIPSDITEISKSLAPFVIVADESGKIISSSAKLHDKAVTIPSGVFDYTKTNGEDKVTWQPEKGVRIALVAKYFENGKGYPDTGFVLAGRSLREVERRAGTMGEQVLVAWAVLLILTFFLESRWGFHRHDEHHRRAEDII